MKNNPWVWISAVALLVATALIVSSANRSAPPTGRTLGAGSVDGGAFLRSVAETLNNLGGNVDLELQPAQPILTASSSKDGKEILATVSENPANLDGQYNYLLANSGNANFYSAGVEPGDIVRYYVNVDEESAERGIDQKAAALELRVRRLDSRDPENALIIETPLNGPSPVPARVEIWRYSDKRMDAIRSTLNRYRDRRLPAVGWEPAPDLGALQQIVERANQWFRSRPPAGKDWKREPLLVPVLDGIPKAPSGLQGDALENYQRSVANLEKQISSDELRDGVFADWEGRLLAESVWARDVSQWARGTADTDDKIAAALFDWTVRNVQLDPTPSPFVSRDAKAPAEPADTIHRPWQALVYGHGSAAHRAWVFVELLRQQNIAAALIRPIDADPAKSPLLVGVFIGDDVQLYDPQLGLPLRNKEGGVATLAEVAADDSLLRQFDVDGEYAYGATAEQIAGVEALVVASPLQLSRRGAELEGSLEGENFVKLSADVQVLADRLAKLPQVKQTNLWMQPFQAYVDEQTIGPEGRVLAVDEFAPLAERPLLWQGRVLHLQGNKGVRADERNDPLAEARDGHQQALVLYQDKNVRLSNRELNKLEPAKRPIYSASKAVAGYWLGLLSYDRGNYDVALGWLEDRTLDQNRSSRWANGARYNLARTQEALGDKEAAIKTLQSDPKDAPQRHGNLLRAKQIAAASPAEEPAKEEPSSESPAATEPATDAPGN
jgi:tetratricopeptide (TPR) repeat protein